MQMESQVLQINIDDIIPNRFQPRISFDEKALNELAASIKEHGIIQPLVLRKLGSKYEIIAGERRYKAATLAGLSTVPAVISNIDDNKSAEIALVENIQRKDLTAIEEARSYKNLLDKGYLTQEQLAKKMGLSQSAISNKLRLLNLDDRVQQALLEGKISERHARALLTLPDKEEQFKWLNKIINERLTVRQLDQELKSEQDDSSGAGIPLVNLTPNIDEIKNNAVDINGNNKPKNIENLLVSEDTMTEYSDTLPSSQNNFNSQPMTQPEVLNSAMPNQGMPNNINSLNQGMFNGPAPGPQQEVLDAVPPTNNRFFNQLEDTPAKMDNLNPFSSDNVFTINNDPLAPNAIVPDISVPSNNVEIFDMPTNPVPPQDVAQSPVVDNMSYNQPTAPTQPIEELNPNNKFFQPAAEPTNMNETIESSPSIVNPMDYVEKLSDSTVVNNDGATLITVINEVRDLVSNLNDRGINVKIDEADLATSYQINLTIIK